MGLLDEPTPNSLVNGPGDMSLTNDFSHDDGSKLL